MRVVRLSTHIVTPTFSKLNLLGLLHIVSNTPSSLVHRIVVAGEHYELYLLVGSHFEDELIQALRSAANSIVCREGSQASSSQIIQIENFRILKQLFTETLRRSIDIESLIASANRDAILRSLREPVRHDTRTTSVKRSPSLLLAPELGKYSTARMPYEDAYPQLDDRIDNKEAYLCTFIALLGLYASFKLEVQTKRDKKKSVRELYIAIPAPRTHLHGLRASVLYWTGRRLAWLSQQLLRSLRIGEEENWQVSVPGFVALVSPVIKDATTSMLGSLELTLFKIVLEDQKQYVRNLVAIGMDSIYLFPDNLVQALLAEIESLGSLVSYVPDFFNLVGEYMLSGNDSIYIEALRVLASALQDRSIPSDVKRVISGILEYAAR